MKIRKKREVALGPPPHLVVEVFPANIADQMIEKDGITIKIAAHGWNWMLREGGGELEIVGDGYKTRLQAEDAGWRAAMELKRKQEKEEK